MATNKFDISKVTMIDILLLAGFAIMGTAIVSGLSVALSVELPELVAAGAGAAIGMAAWIYYVLKRKADHAR